MLNGEKLSSEIKSLVYHCIILAWVFQSIAIIVGFKLLRNTYIRVLLLAIYIGFSIFSFLTIDRFSQYY